MNQNAVQMNASIPVWRHKCLKCLLREPRCIYSRACTCAPQLKTALVSAKIHISYCSAVAANQTDTVVRWKHTVCEVSNYAQLSQDAQREVPQVLKHKPGNQSIFGTQVFGSGSLSITISSGQKGSRGWKRLDTKDKDALWEDGCKWNQEEVRVEASCWAFDSPTMLSFF